MKILVISRSPWRLDNSFGNTYSSIFRDMQDIEIANIYLADGVPEYEPNVTAYYQVSEKELVASFRHPFSSRKTGKVIYLDEPGSDFHEANASYMTVGKQKRWPIMYIMRDLIWKFGRIDYDGIDKFVEDFRPEIIFLPYYYAVYVYRVALHIQKKFNLPMTGEASLDIYSFKQIVFDPIYWLNRLWIRKWIRTTSRRSASLYLISEKMRRDYIEFLKLPCKVLYKIPDLSRKQSEYRMPGKKVHFLFTGNIGTNRWKSLAILVEILREEKFGYLDIYTANAISDDMRKALDVEGYSQLHKPVTQDEVKNLQNAADVLVHAESFDLANKLLVRYSISTKIMDYLCMGRTILGIGPKDIASIEFLHDNETAFVASNKDELRQIIRNIKSNPALLMEYSKKGLAFVGTHMNAMEMKASLRRDLQDIIIEHKQKK